MSSLISIFSSLHPIILLGTIGIFCYIKFYKKQIFFQKKYIVLIIIYPIYIIIFFIMGSIQWNTSKKEQETQRIVNEQRRIEYEQLQERQREIEKQKLIEINPIKVKSINIVCDRLSVQDLLRILIKYDSDADRFESMFIPTGVLWDIDSELYKYRINLTESITDYLLEENLLSIQPSDIRKWIGEAIWGYGYILKEVPVNERVRTHLKFINSGENIKYELYMK